MSFLSNILALLPDNISKRIKPVDLRTSFEYVYADMAKLKLDQVLTLGSITTTSNSVTLGLHASGTNAVRIDGLTYEKYYPDLFNFTPVTTGEKILIIHALPDAQVFHLAQGAESTEAVEPPYSGLFVARLLVTTEGINIEEATAGFKEKANDGWRYITLADNDPKIIEVTASPSHSFNLQPSSTADEPKVVGIKSVGDKNTWDGNELLFFIDGDSEVTFLAGAYNEGFNYVTYAFAETVIGKPYTFMRFKRKNWFYHHIPAGGSASFPETGSNGDVLEKDSAVEGGVKWSNRLTTAENEIDAEVVNRALADGALQGQINTINGRTSSVVDKMLHYWDATAGKWLSSGLKFVSGALEFAGNIKARKIILDSTSGAPAANELSTDGFDWFITNSLGVRNKIARDSGKVDSLLGEFVVYDNKEIYFSAFDYATCTATTTVPHGITTKRRCWAVANRNPTTDLIDSPTFKANAVAIPGEIFGKGLQIERIDDYTLRFYIFNGAQITSINTTTNDNLLRDFTKWHLECPITAEPIISVLPGFRKVRVEFETANMVGANITAKVLYYTNAAGATETKNIASISQGDGNLDHLKIELDLTNTGYYSMINSWKYFRNNTAGGAYFNNSLLSTYIREHTVFSSFGLAGISFGYDGSLQNGTVIKIYQV